MESPTVDTVVVPRTSDIGGFEVRRALPSRERRMVGPFVFLDQMGPERLAPGRGLDVLPHPHIGLATVTYLFEGALVHRDSLGVVQTIEPGALNWMTAGRGIVHSERTPDAERPLGPSMFGLQAWVALPRALEETDPSFFHADARDLPIVENDGVRVRVVAGRMYGEESPVRTASELFYADAELVPGAALPLDAAHDERAAYVVAGSIEVEGDGFEAGRLVVFRAGKPVVIRTRGGARVVLLGGEPLDGPRFVWWNFVSSSRERIEGAKSDWREGRFASVPGETGRIPLPGEPPPPVAYP